MALGIRPRPRRIATSDQTTVLWNATRDAIHQDARPRQRLRVRRLLRRNRAGRPRRTGPPDRRSALRRRRRRADPDRPFANGRRPHADVQRRRLGGRDVRQRHPLRRQVRLRPRHLPAADAADRNRRGVLSLDLEIADGQVERVRVDMGQPILEAAKIPVALPRHDRDAMRDRIVDLPLDKYIPLARARGLDGGLRPRPADDLRLDGQSARGALLPGRGARAAGDDWPPDRATARFSPSASTSTSCRSTRPAK